MKVSVNWLKQLLDFELPVVDELVARIGSQLGEVEEVVDLGKRYQGIIVAKVVECRKHENSDHLNVCKIDDGGKAQNVERDENGHVQVVCGAPNVREGLTVAWLPPGSTVPASFDKDPFVLEVRELRGVKSNGMLASAHELAISDDHTGILEIDKDAQPGEDFAALYKLDDYIIDIENKMFTHRPDCFGVLGVAREMAGILGHKFTSPEWYRPDAEIPEIASETLPLEVKNELSELVPRFMALPMSGVEVRPSPVWLQVALSKVGQKPINNVVDLTNFYMLLTGQPTHAYDYDKVKVLSGEMPTLVVRYAKEGEKISLLNGKEIEPRSEAIMIATDQKLIGVGGVMGGSETEVDENTKNIIIECATFDMYSIRRTSMAHGLFTDAVTRFNKGQSPLQNLAVLAQLADGFTKMASGKVAGQVIDDKHLPPEMLERGSVHPPVSVSPEFINARLGLKLSAEEISRLLKNVEFKVEIQDSKLEATAPFWRTDIEIPEDVVEEVGRLYGYDKLSLELPKRDLTPAPKDLMLELKSKIRANLSKAGANEVLTYSFVHGNLLDKVGQDKAQAFQIANALSPDLQYYRLSLTPSLLEKIHPNIKAGHDEFALFEIGKAHVRHEPDPQDPGVPKEVNALGFVFAADKKVADQKYAGAPYYQASRYLIDMLNVFHAYELVQLEPLAGADLYKNPWIEQMVAPYEPNRSAVLRSHDGLIWGVVGEFKSSVRKFLKLPDFCAGFELDSLLFIQGQNLKSYTALPRFPKVEQDICLKVAADMPYQELYEFVWEKLGEVQPKNTLPTLGPVDIYQRDDDREHKQITLRLSIASYGRTLTGAEVAKLLDHVAEAAKKEFGAERI